MSKRASFPLAPLFLLSLAACGFPKTTDAPPTLPSGDAATSGPDADELARGRALFTEKCNGCHGYPDVASVPAARWPEIMKEMAEKSDLGPEDADKTLAFVLAAQKASSRP